MSQTRRTPYIMNNIENKSYAQINQNFVSLYEEQCKKGYEFLKDKSVIFVGLARDLESCIDHNVQQIFNLSHTFNKLDICIVENDSNDKTVNRFEIIKNKYPDNFFYISNKYNWPKFGSVKDLQRTINLSQLRNQYLDYIFSSDHKYDYIIVTDWDFINFNIEGLTNSFGWMSEKSIDAMCGISLRYQHIFDPNNKHYWNYDSWAFRWNWWHDLSREASNRDPMLWFNLWLPPVGSPPIKINSGFGGMCIYKSDLLSSVRYEGYDCEHVCLNKNLHNKYLNFNLCVNPSQLMLLT